MCSTFSTRQNLKKRSTNYKLGGFDINETEEGKTYKIWKKKKIDLYFNMSVYSITLIKLEFDFV